MTPLANTLKQSESKLRDVENELKKVYPGTKHELDLEFNGCWEATRAANKKFNSLKADIRSAVDNLVVTGGARAGDSQTVAQDARLSTQVSWREQYLDQLTARMQGKADALSNDLATLDDHLESIDSILAREMRLSSAGTPNSAMNSASSGVRAIVNKLPSFLRPPEEADDLSRSDLSVSKLFQDAANQHRPVVNAVRHLSYGLQTLQKKKAY
jgi:ABC-type amino acid transport substrate-binding protein